MTSFNFSQISKHYGKRSILSNIHLQLRAGQCLLLTGQNGTGKTTLMRILAGLEKPDQCLINTNGGSYQWRQYRSQLQAQIMYLHQQPYMFEGSVQHNLAFALPRGLSRAQQQTHIHKIADWAGLGTILDGNAKSLSGGEAQRVAIARALLRKPQAMLLDEPTANMDKAARQRTLEMIGQLRSEGMALLVASHDPEYFRVYADQELHLEQAAIHTRQTTITVTAANTFTAQLP